MNAELFEKLVDWVRDRYLGRYPGAVSDNADPTKRTAPTSEKTIKVENFDASFPVLRRGDPDVIVSVVFADEHGGRQAARLDIQKVMFLDALPEPLNRERTARVITNNIWI